MEELGSSFKNEPSFAAARYRGFAGGLWSHHVGRLWSLPVTSYMFSTDLSLASSVSDQVRMESWSYCTNFTVASPSLLNSFVQLWYHKKKQYGAPIRCCLQLVWVWITITQEPLHTSLQMRVHIKPWNKLFHQGTEGRQWCLGLLNSFKITPYASDCMQFQKWIGSTCPIF